MELYAGVKISIGPPIENGFYYDFEFPDGRDDLRGRLPGDRRADARARQGRRSRSSARTSSVARGARALRRRAPGLQGRADRRPRRDADPGQPLRDRLAVHQRPVHRPLPRSARARARRRSARSSCSRSPAPTGAGTPTRTMLTRIYGTAFFTKAELQRAPRAARAGQGARPPQARPRARACSRSPSSRPERPFWQPAGMAVWNALTELWRE